MSMKVKIGTRGSRLALTQTQLVIDALKKSSPEIEVEIVEIKTLGCRKQGTASASITDKKEWVEDLELALNDNSIDLAIHSGKDIPVDIADGTELFPVLARANPYDAFIGRINRDTGMRINFKDLPPGAKIGTASLRRQAQLLRMRPDLDVVEHRGNIDTRLRKLDESDDMMGIVLACSGLDRLQFTDLNYEIFPAKDLLPAVNQGILVAQARANHAELIKKLHKIVVKENFSVWQAERAVAEALNGDCNSAISIFATIGDDTINLDSRVMSVDGKDFIETSAEAPSIQARDLGISVGENLLKNGAAKIIASSKNYIKK